MGYGYYLRGAKQCCFVLLGTVPDSIYGILTAFILLIISSFEIITQGCRHRYEA